MPKIKKNIQWSNISGQEKSEFWSALGGKGPYTDVCEFKVNSNTDFVPRLFQGSNASGYFKSSLTSFL